MSRTSILRELTARRACCERDVIVPVEIIDAVINELAPPAFELEEAALRTHQRHHVTATELFIWRMLRNASAEVKASEMRAELANHLGRAVKPNTLEVHICRLNEKLRKQSYPYRVVCQKRGRHKSDIDTTYILRGSNG